MDSMPSGVRRCLNRRGCNSLSASDRHNVRGEGDERAAFIEPSQVDLATFDAHGRGGF
jgi:hypothetical protein